MSFSLRVRRRAGTFAASGQRRAGVGPEYFLKLLAIFTTIKYHKINKMITGSQPLAANSNTQESAATQ